MTIMLPLALIYILHKKRSDFGIYFPRFSDSLKLSLRAYGIAGPAGITFLLIGILGWGFQDWLGSITLSIVYLVVFYFYSEDHKKATYKRSYNLIQKKRNRCINYL